MLGPAGPSQRRSSGPAAARSPARPRGLALSPAGRRSALGRRPPPLGERGRSASSAWRRRGRSRPRGPPRGRGRVAASAFPAASPAPFSRPSQGPDWSPRPGGRRDATRHLPTRLGQRGAGHLGHGQLLRLGDGGGLDLGRGTGLLLETQKREKEERGREKKEEEERKEKEKKKTPLFDWATGHAQCDGRFRVPVPLAAFCERPGLGSGGGGEPPNAAWAGDRTRHRGGPRQAGAPPAVQLGHFLSCAHGSRASQGCLTGRDTDPAVRAAHQG